MINFLKGTVEYKEEDYLVLDVHDVGYLVFVSGNTFAKIEKDEAIKLFIYQNIRENVDDLYGFLDRQTLEFFKLLVSVSGVGPKTAIGILTKADAQKIKTAIFLENAEMLIKGCNIGKKTAERLIIELKSKIQNDDSDNDTGKSPIRNDVFDALETLGYKKSEIFDILKIIPNDLDESEKLKWALKNLSMDIKS